MMEPKKILSKNIQKYLDQRGITQTKLANDLGFPEMTVSNWIKEKTYPRVDRLQQMADYFNVRRSDLTEDKSIDDNLLTNAEKMANAFLPVKPYNFYPSISAGLPNDVECVDSENVNKIYLPDIILGTNAGKKDIYAFRVNGDSMNRVIPDQSIVVAKKANKEDLMDEDLVVYKYQGEYAIKRFFRSDDTIIFRPDSHDPTFTDQVINLNDNELELEIKGKIVYYGVSIG